MPCTGASDSGPLLAVLLILLKLVSGWSSALPDIPLSFFCKSVPVFQTE